MQSELQKILGAESFKKYVAALAAPLKEFKALLPDEISEKVAENFIQFISSKQGSNITIAYEKRIKELDAQIESS